MSTVVAVVAVVAFPDKAPVNVVVVKLPVEGLYVSGFVVISIYGVTTPAEDTNTG
jgi:hypothetical protein